MFLGENSEASVKTVESTSNSTVLLPIFSFQEIRLGKLIGRGGFSTVSEIRYINLLDEDNDAEYDNYNNVRYSLDHEEHEIIVQKRKEFARLAKTPDEENGLYKYVLKTLRSDLPEEEHRKGVNDLAVEAEFLSILNHPNIITMRGMANTVVGGSNNNDFDNNGNNTAITQHYHYRMDRFFVILDRLVSTLDNKFNLWRKFISKNSGYWLGPFGYCCSRPHELYEIWLQRLQYTRDITKAIQYLHEKKIIYRDLKPDNIGFDQFDQLKIFDLGLAKRVLVTTKTIKEQQKQHQSNGHQEQLQQQQQNDDSNNDNDIIQETDSGLFFLTGNTGSLRYMAPEVALGLPYNYKADTFSFGILFWQMCSLVVPFSGFTTRMHSEKVVNGTYRPKMDTTWPEPWRNLMESCWAKDIYSRPDFDTISKILDEQVEEFLSNNDEADDPTSASSSSTTRASTINGTKTTEIRSKLRKKNTHGDENNIDNGQQNGNHAVILQLDVDTRKLSTAVADNKNAHIKRFDKDIV